ncbi:ADP-ribose pyrophosphatase YjhB, NUDIX family [Halogranum amylolyticum]|uniref:ADP-ribose pyrophosphatase YjhB, NUDIX family n=1 Tax=Halogranum amylolyticum TaxID=660520 RepID=A0A1H8PVC8_9EURY|nr:NUDIX domain-containing protein [Halogranum amylolyticum]SEO45962.1 ADP-ribose pyrophosphatase YjhB, NUDIX family [Halogranum amylolyticum]
MSDEHLQATISQKAALFGPDGDLLLLSRAATAGWELPGGRIGTTEDVVPGLRREVREETGLDVAVEEPVYTDAWSTEDGEGRYAVVYRCSTDDCAVSPSDEHDDWRWVAPDVAVEDVLSTPRLRTAVERAAERRAVVR